MKVTVVPDRLELGPGETGEFEVAIQNAGGVVEHFGTTVVGLPRDDLYTVEPSVVKLRPRDSGTVRVRITVPERGGMVAGPYTLGVLVRSPFQREVSRCEELALGVRPAPGLAMEVRPEVVLGGRAGEFGVSLSNEGNTPLAVALAGSDRENRVAFEFEPARLELDPGMSAGAAIRVRANPPMTGQEVRRDLTVKALAGSVTAEKTATFTQKPRIAGGLLRVAGIAAGIAVLAGAAVGGAMLIQDDKPDQVSQTAPITPPAEPTTQASPTTEATSGAVAEPTIVDFSRTPDGQPVRDGIIAGDLYAAQGVTLSTVVEKAPAACQDATAVALRATAAFGGFLTSSKPASADRCNSVPVRMDFTAPMRQVNLTVIGTGGEYVLLAQLADGTVEERRISPPPNAPTLIPYEAPAGSSVKSVSFGHSAPAPNAPTFTVIKSAALIPG